MANSENHARVPIPDARPTALPSELSDFLRDQEYAALLHETNHGTVFIVKLPLADIDSVRGRVPIGLQSELYAHPRAPVVRTVMRIFDKPAYPLAFEVFTNVADRQQRHEFALLARQEHTHLLFYDEQHDLRLVKQLRSPGLGVIDRILADADAHRATIDDDSYDFDSAKAAVLSATPI